MYISRFKLGNYKSFHEPPELEFTPGFNIVSGQNNAGKTALLEALGLNFGGKPHRSAKTMPARDTIPGPVSWADVSFALPPNELIELMLASGGGTFSLVKPDLGSAFAKKVGYVDDSRESVQKLWREILSEQFLTFKLRMDAGGAGWNLRSLPSFGLYPAQGGRDIYQYVDFRLGLNREMTNSGGAGRSQMGDIGLQLAGAFQRHVYRFNAERMNIGRGPHGVGTQLAPNAANLPEVLNQLQRNPSKFAALNRTLSTILPQVKQISVQAIGPGQLEILVWPHDPESQRDDLAVPLSESGTGIGQVLAILYVVMTSDRPQVIIVDEPQSFLHPGAARKLIEFLRMNGQHQFIIATHSPTVIAAADPKTITLVRYENAESTLQQLDATLERGMQATLADLGIRLSDSFGADNILWVEGRTEERCFRLIVEKLLRRPLRGTEILGIRQTGDLESRDAKKMFEIYRSLTEGGSLLPPAIAFILDQECRNENAKRELCHLSGGRVRFLPRRMYENYLLNPEAIATVVNAISDFSSEPISVQAIREAVDRRLGNRTLHCSTVGVSNVSTVDGARVLAEIFNEFSDTRVPYEKVRHGIALTEWLIEHRREDLGEIAELLGEIIRTKS
jgi:predicted ATPase